MEGDISNTITFEDAYISYLNEIQELSEDEDSTKD